MVERNMRDDLVTRGVAAQVTEYERQQVNDDSIRDVLADFGGYESYDDMVAPESLHTVDIMHTLNMNLWEEIFKDDAWRTATCISGERGFGITHHGGSMDRPVLVRVGDMLERLDNLYVDWSSRWAGWPYWSPIGFCLSRPSTLATLQAGRKEM